MDARHHSMQVDVRLAGMRPTRRQGASLMHPTQAFELVACMHIYSCQRPCSMPCKRSAALPCAHGALCLIWAAPRVGQRGGEALLEPGQARARTVAAL